MKNGAEPKPMPEDLELGPRECDGSIAINEGDKRMILNPLCDHHARMAVMAYAYSLAAEPEEDLSPGSSPLSKDGDFTLSEYMLLSLNDILTEDERGLVVLIMNQDELRAVWKSLSLRTLTLQTTLALRTEGKQEAEADLSTCKNLMGKVNVIVQQSDAQVPPAIPSEGSHKASSTGK